MKLNRKDFILKIKIKCKLFFVILKDLIKFNELCIP